MSFKLGLAVDSLSPALTGIGRYCWELVSRLPYHPDIDAITFWRGNDRVRAPERLLAGQKLDIGKRTKVRRWLLRRARSIGLASDRALWPKDHDFGLFHGPNFMLPPWVESGIITVHDLSVFLYPETHPVERIRSFERDFDASLKRATHIITPSETIRQELAQFAGIKPGRISAVSMGVGPAFLPVQGQELENALSALGLPLTGYGLALAALEPRKRIDRLIAAWRILPHDLRRRYPLVIAGAPGWKNEQLQQEITRAVSEGWAISLGYVGEASLPALYSGARLFAYPSVYEGFGMPPIEAMACGVPVAVARASCLPEVTGGAALLIDPEDIEGTSLALAEALTDGRWRAAATTRGRAVAARLSWDNCVAGTIAAYGRA